MYGKPMWCCAQTDGSGGAERWGPPGEVTLPRPAPTLPVACRPPRNEAQRAEVMGGRRGTGREQRSLDLAPLFTQGAHLLGTPLVISSPLLAYCPSWGAHPQGKRSSGIH